MKRIVCILGCMVLFAVILPKGHIHDEYCGYNEVTNTGCVYDIAPCYDKSWTD